MSNVGKTNIEKQAVLKNLFQRIPAPGKAFFCFSGISGVPWDGLFDNLVETFAFV